jgi:hypothetical protein
MINIFSIFSPFQAIGKTMIPQFHHSLERVISFHPTRVAHQKYMLAVQVEQYGQRDKIPFKKTPAVRHFSRSGFPES